MQGVPPNALINISKKTSCALACASRHIWPGTISLKLSASSVRHSLISPQGQSRISIVPATLANVVSLSLELASDLKEDDDDNDLRQFAVDIVQRLPNLIAASIWLHAESNVCALQPLLRLRHLDLGLGNVEALDGLPFGALSPALETLCITYMKANPEVHAEFGYELEAYEAEPIAVLDVSGCPQLRRLVLRDMMPVGLPKPPGCWLRFEVQAPWRTPEEASRLLQPALSKVNELLFGTTDMTPLRGLLETGLPKLQSIRCGGWDKLPDYDDEEDEEDDGDGGGNVGCDWRASNLLLRFLRHGRNFPALKSILCGYEDDPPAHHRIPADLAGDDELIIASKESLKLVFESARSAGERLSTFFAVGRKVTVEAAALRAMTRALSRRGLTLSVASAGKGHKHGRMQCMYVHARSAPQMSYEDAMRCVTTRLQSWQLDPYACGQCACGACFKCLRAAGTVDGK